MRFLLLAVAAFVFACSNAEDAPPDAPTGECISASDCNDNDACTTDTCNASHTCEHAAKAVDDSIDCTTDTCDPATGDVSHTPVNTMCEKDGKSCTVATCSATTGCSETPTPSMCNDNATCSTETCDPTAAGADATTGCKVTLDDSACSDSFSCTANTCSPTAVAADATTGCLVVPNDNACGDSVSCTVDTCNPAGGGADAAGCVHQTMNNLCEVDGKSCTVATCDATAGCSETPTDSLCNDNASCSTETCSATGPGATGCVVVLDDAACADSAECSTDSCNPTLAGAGTGCYHAADATACSPNAMCGATFDCVCNAGYDGTGLTCTGITCDTLADPDNGLVQTTNNGLYPSTATYVCDPGFAPVGTATRTCGTDGSWSGAAPACQPTIFVVRVGDGTAALSNASTAVFIEERSLDGTLLHTYPLPTAANGSNAPLSIVGNSPLDGGLSLSGNGAYVTLAGYAAAPGTASIAGTSNRSGDTSPVNRVVALVSPDGSIDTSTRLVDAFSGSNVRAACTVDGNAFWVSGNSSGSPMTGGVHYVSFGSAGAATQVLSTMNNARHVHAYDGQLYVSSGAGTNTHGVYAVGSGLPTAAGQTATALSGDPTSSVPISFAVFDVEDAVAGVDTVYMAIEQGGAAGKVNVQKWTKTGTTWSQATFAPTVTGGGTPNTVGLAAWEEGDDIRLVVTTSEGSARILTFVDDFDNTAPAATVIGTATTNTAFRGVARSPSP